ncbi:MAG TPA: hypothetical protein VG097_15320 [Gemmata sp.]|nr:hypothetical protein [Gemmata sp.]
MRQLSTRQIKRLAACRQLLNCCRFVNLWGRRWHRQRRPVLELGQSLSALYPPGIDEKRSADGVLARKKCFGL